MEIHFKKKDERAVFKASGEPGSPLSFLPGSRGNGTGGACLLHPPGGCEQRGFCDENFSFTRGDNPDDVLENYSRMAAALGREREKGF